MNPTEAFGVLGIPEESSDLEIRRRFLELAMVHHPDRGGRVEDFTRVNEAYRVARSRPCPKCKGERVIITQEGFGSRSAPCPACAAPASPAEKKRAPKRRKRR